MQRKCFVETYVGENKPLLLYWYCRYTFPVRLYFYLLFSLLSTPKILTDYYKYEFQFWHLSFEKMFVIYIIFLFCYIALVHNT